MITPTKSRLTICIVLLTAWLAFIWGNSMTPGDVSGEMSGWVSTILGKFLPLLSPNTEYGHLLVRKIAHFSAFMILGILMRWLFSMLLKKKWLRFFTPLCCGMACAVIDEFIQFFTPGRVCSFWDMCIDWSGAITGVSLLALLGVLIKRKGKI